MVWSMITDERNPLLSILGGALAWFSVLLPWIESCSKRCYDITNKNQNVLASVFFSILGCEWCLKCTELAGVISMAVSLIYFWFIRTHKNRLSFLLFISFQQGYDKDIFRIVTFGIHYILVWLQLALSFVPNPVYISQKVKQNSTAYYGLYGDKNALGFQTLWEITSCLISIIVLLKNSSCDLEQTFDLAVAFVYCTKLVISQEFFFDNLGCSLLWHSQSCWLIWQVT